MSDEFFIGWQGKTPAKTGRFLKAVALAAVGGAIVAAAVLAALQQTVSQEASFDYGNIQEFRGVMVVDPVPMLIADDVVYYLVNPFKFGFDRSVAQEHHLQWVLLQGTRIHRGDEEMIEVVPASVERVPQSRDLAGHPLGESQDLGEITLKGEIVDAKCYLGVMNPGNLKPHRACAINCIEGGIPPVLLVRDRKGAATYVLLVRDDGSPINAAILDFVAEPVRVRGRLKRRGDQLILFADPARFSRE